jgi:DNA-3-methyladenine glycosylase
MRMRRGSPLLCSGPGRLTQALGIRPDDDGAPFDAIDFSITLPSAMAELLVGPRIGISKATDLPWRFGLAGASGLSRPFPPQTL